MKTADYQPQPRIVGQTIEQWAERERVHWPDAMHYKRVCRSGCLFVFKRRDRVLFVERGIPLIGIVCSGTPKGNIQVLVGSHYLILDSWTPAWKITTL